MSLKGFQNFERMEDPGERKAPDIVHGNAEPEKSKFKKKSKGSVSVSTLKSSGFILTVIFWGIFLSAVTYGIVKVLGAYTNG